MANCLVTQLKEVVQNNNLEIFGRGEFELFNGGTNYIQFNAGTKITVISGDLTLNGKTEITIPDAGGSLNDVVASGNGIIAVSNKYAIFAINIAGQFDSKAIAYSALKNLTLTRYSSSRCNDEIRISDFVNCPLKSITINSNYNLVGSYGDLMDLGFTDVKIYNAGGLTLQNFKIKMYDLGRNTNTNTFGSIMVAIKTNNVSGSIEDFVAARKVAGQSASESNVTFTYLGNSATIYYKGVIVGNKQTNIITWTANGDNTNISYNNGETTNITTIHVNADGSWTRVS